MQAGRALEADLLYKKPHSSLRNMVLQTSDEGH